MDRLLVAVALSLLGAGEPVAGGEGGRFEESTARALENECWVQSIEERSKDADPAVRLGAARAVAAATHRVGEGWLEGYTLLVLSNGSPEVRLAGLDLARNLMPRTLSVSPFREAIGACLEAEESEVVDGALRVVARLSAEARQSNELRKGLLRAIEGPEFVRRAGRLTDIVRWTAVEPAFVNRLLLVARDPERRQIVTDVQRRLEGARPGVLRVALDAEEWYEQPKSHELLRRELVSGVRRLRWMPPALLERLLEVDDVAVRAAVLNGIDRDLAADGALDDVLAASLLHDNAHVRAAASSAVSVTRRRRTVLRIALERADGAPNPAAVAELRDRLIDSILAADREEGFDAEVAALTRHDRAEVRLRAWSTRLRVTGEYGPTVEGLSDLLTARDATVRAGAAMALGALRHHGRSAIPKLLPLLNDDDERVTSAAIDTVRKLSDPPPNVDR